MSSIDVLFQTPPGELIAELKALRDERVLIERKEQMLQQVLDAIAQRGGDAADEIAALGGEAGLGTLREQILSVLESVREESDATVALVPQEVLEQLAARGNSTVKLPNVRVTMKRMFNDNELERPYPEYGVVYALPGTVEKFPREIASLGKLLKEGVQR